MRRIPIIPTLLVGAAVAVMIGLGFWQLSRAGWKERMLAELAAAQSLPPVDLDPLIANGRIDETPIAFRRVLVTCAVQDAAPALRAGRNLDGVVGYSAYVPCRPGDTGVAGRLSVNAGWVSRPNPALRVSLQGIVAGIVGTAEPGAPIILTAASANAPFSPSAPPRIEDIPNNHLAYAGQWFFFAAAALAIYLLALRSRRRG